MASTYVRQVQDSTLPIGHLSRGILALLLLVVWSPVLALDPLRQPSQYVLDNWQISEGLPQISAQAIARTPDGYLWIGTQEGLARFDGVRFTVFDTNNEPALPNNFITVLFVDRLARLWIGTSGGIAVLDNGHFTAFTKIAQIEHAFVHSIIEGKGGRLWVGTENGLFEIADDRALSFNVAEGLPHGRIGALHEDHKGVLWAGTDEGLARFDGSRFKAVQLPGETVGTAVRAIHEDDDGTLWVGTEKGGLYRGTGDQFDVAVQAGPFGPKHLGAVRALSRDHDGNLWICTRSGLARWRNGELRRLDERTICRERPTSDSRRQRGKSLGWEL